MSGYTAIIQVRVWGEVREVTIWRRGDIDVDAAIDEALARLASHGPAADGWLVAVDEFGEIVSQLCLEVVSLRVPGPG